MAVQTPAHRQRRILPHQRHSIHTPVAACASDSLLHVNAVIEVNKPGQVMNPGPDNRLSCAPALPHWRKRGTRRPHLRMAVHADLRGGNARVRGVFNSGVAVAAINAESADVMLVTKRNGLLSWNALHSHIAGAAYTRDCPESARNDDEERQKDGSHDGVRGRCEVLGHPSHTRS